ncbi:hypothetical protein HK102_012450, partial [Quaeritorhiza haematococci]
MTTTPKTTVAIITTTTTIAARKPTTTKTHRLDHSISTSSDEEENETDPSHWHNLYLHPTTHTYSDSDSDYESQNPSTHITRRDTRPLRRRDGRPGTAERGSRSMNSTPKMYYDVPDEDEDGKDVEGEEKSGVEDEEGGGYVVRIRSRHFVDAGKPLECNTTPSSSS